MALLFSRNRHIEVPSRSVRAEPIFLQSGWRLNEGRPLEVMNNGFVLKETGRCHIMLLYNHPRCDITPSRSAASTCRVGAGCRQRSDRAPWGLSVCRDQVIYYICSCICCCAPRASRGACSTRWAAPGARRARQCGQSPGCRPRVALEEGLQARQQMMLQIRIRVRAEALSHGRCGGAAQTLGGQ